MIAVPNDTALATRLQLFCGTLDSGDVTARYLLTPYDRPTEKVHSALEAPPLLSFSLPPPPTVRASRSLYLFLVHGPSRSAMDPLSGFSIIVSCPFDFREALQASISDTRTLFA